MRWVLDDGVLGIISSVLAASDLASWSCGHFLIAAQTKIDAALSQRREAITKAVSNTGEEPVIASFDLAMGSESASILYSHFRNPNATQTANLAEHQALSWLLTEDLEAVFVSLDKTALVLALSELGRTRAAYAYELWGWLLEKSFVGKEVFDELCRRTHKSSQSVSIPWRCKNR